MSILKQTRRFLFLLGVLGAAPACNPVPVMLLDVNNLPPDSFRINVIAIRGTSVGKALFQREDKTNKWLPMESQTVPPSQASPPATQVAVELPRGASGAMTLDIEIDGPPVDGMMGTATGAPQTGQGSLANACLHVNLIDGALNEITVPLIATVADKLPCM
jgi:hypothetical protein